MSYRGNIDSLISLRIPPNTCAVNLWLLCFHIFEFHMVLAFSNFRTPGFHVISIDAFSRHAGMGFFLEKWEFDEWLFVFLLGLYYLLFVSLPLSHMFGPWQFTLWMVLIAKVTVLGFGLKQSRESRQFELFFVSVLDCVLFILFVVGVFQVSS